MTVRPPAPAEPELAVPLAAAPMAAAIIRTVVGPIEAASKALTCWRSSTTMTVAGEPIDVIAQASPDNLRVCAVETIETVPAPVVRAVCSWVCGTEAVSAGPARWSTCLAGPATAARLPGRVNEGRSVRGTVTPGSSFGGIVTLGNSTGGSVTVGRLSRGTVTSTGGSEIWAGGRLTLIPGVTTLGPRPYRQTANLDGWNGPRRLNAQLLPHGLAGVRLNRPNHLGEFGRRASLGRRDLPDRGFDDLAGGLVDLGLDGRYALGRVSFGDGLPGHPCGRSFLCHVGDPGADGDRPGRFPRHRARHLGDALSADRRDLPRHSLDRRCPGSDPDLGLGGRRLGDHLFLHLGGTARPGCRPNLLGQLPDRCAQGCRFGVGLCGSGRQGKSDHHSGGRHQDSEQPAGHTRPSDAGLFTVAPPLACPETRSVDIPM